MDILFPVKGLHEGAAYARQPEGTTPSCLNVRGRDPVTDRLRGGQRNGTSKYCQSIVNGANQIVAGTCVTKIDSRVTYTTVTDVTGAELQTDQPSRLDTISIATDQQGNIYTAAATSGGGSGLNAIVKYNSAFVRQWTYTLPQGRATDVLKSIRLEEADDGRLVIYCVVTGSSTGPTRIYRLVESVFPFPVVIEWFMDAPNGGWWTDCSVKDGVMYAVELTSTPSTILHRIDNLASSAGPTITWSATIRTGASAEECYAVTHADDGAALCAIVDPAVINANGAIEKFGPMQPDTTTPAGATSANSLARWTTRGTLANEQGLGQGIVNKGGYLFTSGYGSGGSLYRVRRLKDLGASVSDSGGNGGLALTLDANSTFVGANSLAVDDDLNVYVTTDSGSTDTIVTKVSAAFSNVWELTGTELGVNNMNAYAVAVHPIPADVGGEDEQAEFLYVGTEAESSSYYSLHKIRLCTVTQADGSSRSTFNYAICNGAVKHVTASAVNAVSGSASLNTTARWVSMAAGLNLVLITDGLNYYKIDVLTGTYGTVSAWTASVGEIPKRARQVYIWGGMAVLIDFEHDPHQWALSTVGDFDDWDFFPIRTDIVGAVLGSGSQAGLCPDIITTFVPFSDDLAFFGGDHTIQRMTGHPSDGGRFDLVTDITGMARGRSWCKSPSGTVYFVGSRGGFFAINPGSTPQEISVEPLSDRFRDLDIGSNKIQLLWNDKEKGVHVFVTPYSAGETTHYFWSAREDAWWPDRFTNTNHDPLAVWVFDGDSTNDRAILLGGRDGYVRKFDELARDDDGTAIDSWCYMPVMAGQHSELRLSNFRCVLGNSSDPVEFKLFAIDQPDFNLINTDPLDPDSNVPPWITKSIERGRNSNIRDRIRGNAVLVRVRNNDADERWSVETIACDAEPAGRARTRARLEAEELIVPLLNQWGDNYGSDTNSQGDMPAVFYGLAIYSNGGGGGGGGGGDGGGNTATPVSADGGVMDIGAPPPPGGGGGIGGPEGGDIGFGGAYGGPLTASPISVDIN